MTHAIENRQKRYVDEPVVATHIYLIALTALTFVQSTIAVANHEWPYTDLTFRYSPALRSLCYSTASLGVLITSWVLGLGWTIPMTLIGMWVAPGFASFVQGADLDINYVSVQTHARWGILIGLTIGLVMESGRRRKLRNKTE